MTPNKWTIVKTFPLEFGREGFIAYESTLIHLT
jgi:hypothetical protein